MKKLLFGLIATVMLTFTVNAQGTLRADFLKGKTYDEVKKSYVALEKRDKISLWNEKLSQILTQELDDKIKSGVASLQKEFNNDVLNNDKIKEIALYLTDNMSEEQFEDMFLKLDDYVAKDYKPSNVLDGYKTQIREQTMNFEVGVNDTDKALKIPCNCDWTCSSMCSHPTSKCKMTSSGCGFMWAFECTRAC